MGDQSTGSADQSSVNEAFRELGYPDRLLPSAISAFKTAEGAQRWIAVLGNLALRSEYIYEIAMSGLQPDDYARWRDAGLHDMNALRLPRRMAAVGLNVDDYRRWTGAGLGAGLEHLLSYVQAGLPFDDLIDVLANWGMLHDSEVSGAVPELMEMLQRGLKIDEIQRLLETGVTGHQLFPWCTTGIPSAEWPAWMSLNFGPGKAEQYFTAGMSAAAAKPWRDIGVAAVIAFDLIKAGVPPATAGVWIGAGIPASGVLSFLQANVPLKTAALWVEAGVTAREAADFIEKGVTLDDAIELGERGIAAQQVKRTESGLELDLEPWQEDPVDQLPSAIAPGRICLTLWTTVLGDDPQAHDVCFTWDGRHTAEWDEDISAANGGLSPASSSPVWGVASWPDGEDVLLTYTWSDLGMRGYARLTGEAPISGSSGAEDPRQWARLGNALIEFVQLDLGSGRRDRENLSAEYYDPVEDQLIELDELFRIFLAGADTSSNSSDFDQWLRDKLNSGAYEIP